jgi:2-keto-4-pentenoate hydratase/2-oxohepta-3-ene-1,7-dioic acid hydratase in catechol pathway
MRLCRFRHNNGPRYGLLESIAGADHITHTLPGPQLHTTEVGLADRIILPSEEDAEKLPRPLSLEEVTLLTPLPLLSKIVCVGRNYREHAKELGHEVPAEPLIFLKPPSAILPPGGTIVRPKLSQNVHFEGELGVVIGKICHRLAPGADVRDYILGYTCVNDVTARDLQKKDGQWSRAKGFDTFCPIGPAIALGLDPWKGLKIRTWVNGEIKQDGTTADFIFPIEVVIRYIAEVMTLLPGDVIATGTPSGVGPLVAGDTVEVTVEGVGTLSNPVIDEPK